MGRVQLGPARAPAPRRDPSASSPARRPKTGLDHLWDRLQARLERTLLRTTAESPADGALLAELMRLPEAERLVAVEREPRFWSLGLVEQLLETAEPAPPALVLHLTDLALALVRRLGPPQHEPSLVVEREVGALSLQAEAHRRLGDFACAESGFSAAAHRLATEPLDVPERAIFCRYLARLRQDQGRDDEALGLFQRAADLFEQWQEPAAAAEALCELGWLCLDGGDPASAQPALEQALVLLKKAPRPQALARVWFGLALAYADLRLLEEARHALGSAKVLSVRVPETAESLRHRILEARVLERLGEGVLAAARLESALPGLLALGAFYDTAIAAIDLAQIYAALGWGTEVERLRATIAPLSGPEALPDHIRSVLLFALHLASRPQRDATELLAEAGEFLERARERPWLRFEVAPHPRHELFWGLLAPAERQPFCEQAGLPVDLAELPAAELTGTQRDLLTWTSEALAGVRISFEPQSGPAAGPTWKAES